MKFVKPILVFAFVSLAFYAFPELNCVINTSTTCVRPFYERNEIATELILDVGEFSMNRNDYQAIADLMVKNDIKYIRLPSDIGNLESEISDQKSPIDSRQFPIISSTMVNGKPLIQIFRERRLSEVSSSDNWKRVEFQKRIYRRGVWQHYLYCPDDNCYVFNQTGTGGMQKSIIVDGDRVERLWTGWFLVTIGDKAVVP